MNIHILVYYGTCAFENAPKMFLNQMNDLHCFNRVFVSTDCALF